jgi:hypothetical protein
MIGVGQAARLGVLGLSASAYDPRFRWTLGTTAYSDTHIHRFHHDDGGQNGPRSKLDVEHIVEVVIDHQLRMINLSTPA